MDHVSGVPSQDSVLQNVWDPTHPKTIHHNTDGKELPTFLQHEASKVFNECLLCELTEVNQVYPIAWVKF